MTRSRRFIKYNYHTGSLLRRIIVAFTYRELLAAAATGRCCRFGAIQNMLPVYLSVLDGSELFLSWARRGPQPTGRRAGPRAGPQADALGAAAGACAVSMDDCIHTTQCERWRALAWAGGGWRTGSQGHWARRHPALCPRCARAAPRSVLRLWQAQRRLP
jgi:hypothetical protein